MLNNMDVSIVQTILVYVGNIFHTSVISAFQNDDENLK